MPSATDSPAVIEVEDLQIAFRTLSGLLPVIDSVSFSLAASNSLGIVGESGSGKSMLCRALIGTLRRRGAIITGGRVRIGGRDMTVASESSWQQVRGRVLGYVPQASLAGLNPILTIRESLVEAIRVGREVDSRDGRREARELLDLVRVARSYIVLDQRPHELSGGMRQRVMIAAAIIQRPKALIADEPTTAIDVTAQFQILSLLADLRRDLGMALILVSHDVSVVESMCERVMVMYAGAGMEIGAVDRVTSRPRHPYTAALLASRVDRAEPGQALGSIEGEPPTLGHWPHGCRFVLRCSVAEKTCGEGRQPPLSDYDGRLTACLFPSRTPRASP